VVAPPLQCDADFLFERIDLIDADDSAVVTTAMVERTLDDLGADAEPLHAAGAAAAKILQPPSLRVCPKTSGGITKFSEHEAD